MKGPLRVARYGAIATDVDVVEESPLADVTENWQTNVPAIVGAVGIDTLPVGPETLPDAVRGPVHEYVAEGASDMLTLIETLFPDTTFDAVGTAETDGITRFTC